MAIASDGLMTSNTRHNNRGAECTSHLGNCSQAQGVRERCPGAVWASRGGLTTPGTREPASGPVGSVDSPWNRTARPQPSPQQRADHMLSVDAGFPGRAENTCPSGTLSVHAGRAKEGLCHGAEPRPWAALVEGPQEQPQAGGHEHRCCLGVVWEQHPPRKDQGFLERRLIPRLGGTWPGQASPACHTGHSPQPRVTQPQQSTARLPGPSVRPSCPRRGPPGCGLCCTGFAPMSGPLGSPSAQLSPWGAGCAPSSSGTGPGTRIPRCCLHTSGTRLLPAPSGRRARASSRSSPTSAFPRSKQTCSSTALSGAPWQDPVGSWVVGDGPTEPSWERGSNESRPRGRGQGTGGARERRNGAHARG